LNTITAICEGARFYKQIGKYSELERLVSTDVTINAVQLARRVLSHFYSVYVKPYLILPGPVEIDETKTSTERGLVIGNFSTHPHFRVSFLNLTNSCLVGFWAIVQANETFLPLLDQKSLSLEPSL
jgi:hypothetical protein